MVPLGTAQGGGARVTRAANVAWRIVDGAAVLVSPSSAVIQTLNPVGTRVWELADGRSLEEIAEQIMNEFEVTRTQAMEDVREFVRTLDGKGLVSLASGGPA